MIAKYTPIYSVLVAVPLLLFSVPVINKRVREITAK